MPAFRSQLEVKVANELDHQGVAWEYEVPVKLPDGRSLWYLPDFTINSANNLLKLPKWVEAKPQDFLYSLRDLLGVTRKHGDRFAGEILCEEITSADLRSMLVEELWKPKRLAELTGESVLIVGTVGAISSLSIEMAPHLIKFSRQHPFVNWVGIQKAEERKQKRLKWEAEAAEHAATRQRIFQENQEQQRQAMKEELKATLAFRHIGPTKWSKACFGCNSFVQAGQGSLRKVQFTDGSLEWRVLCSNCCHC